MDQSKLDPIRAALEKEKISLAHQLEEMGAPVESAGVLVSVDEGFADSAQATAGRSEILSLVDELRSMYSEVSAALARIEDGTFGKCERCGQEVPIERLEALPTARLCVSCKQAQAS
ncbi:MAG: TraR/DksA family transcriptional regulator [Actinomycetota bacterium]